MNHRINIPDTNLSICPIGLGTVNAGLAWTQDIACSIFDAYIDNGGNMIDTARVYASGRSEEVVGNWLASSKKRDQIVIVTKGGHPKFDSPNDDLHISRMTRNDMRADIEASLKCLKTEYIDLYFYHRDDRTQSVEEEIEVMEDFRREGKILYYGCSNWNADRIEEADRYCQKMGYRGFVADQALLNIGVKHMNPLPDDTLVYVNGELYDYHLKNEHNLVMPYMGVASGYFHKYAKAGAEGVKMSPYHTPYNVAVAKHCIELSKEYGVSITQVVLGFFFQQRFKCAPLYGPKDASQIIEALRTLDIPFKKEDYNV